MKKYFLGFSVAMISALAFAQDAQETFSLRKDTATVFDGAGKARFRADQDFILKYSDNDGRKIYDWQADTRLVRIDAQDGIGIWLSCADLMPIEGKCEAPTNSVKRNDVTRGQGTRGFSLNSAVPMCPGDPRCPRF